MLKRIYTLAFVVAPVFAPAVIHAEAGKTLKDAGQAIRTAAYDITDKNSVTLSFDAKSATLTDSQKNQLKALSDSFASDGKVRDVVVAAYSDKNYPKGKDTLTKQERDLAAKRGDAVKAHLSSIGRKSVTIYNMAEKANWFERKLVMKDAQVKREATEKADNVSNDDAFFEALGRHLTSVGGPGKVIVLMRHEAANPSI